MCRSLAGSTTTPKTMAVCPRCNSIFECHPQSHANCECKSLQLSDAVLSFLKDRYETCLCLPCLKQLAFEIENSKKLNPFSSALVLFFSIISFMSAAQTYPGPAGQAGSTAIYKDSSVFVAWATGCKIQRGWQDISNTSLGTTTVGDSSMALGKALSNAVVSLGDGGIATCTFAKPISNGPGFDFAIFENSIDDTFLELAFVEVSSDGINFFRFNSHSLCDTTVQTGGFGSTDTKKISNLAGKYRAGYGTPFDLMEIMPNPGINRDAVTHVRVVDVVGSISNAYARRDFFNNKINDPWPTAFPSGGFDLDAIGVINQSTLTAVDEKVEGETVFFYPSFIRPDETTVLHVTGNAQRIEIFNVEGVLVQSTKPAESTVELVPLRPGLYFLRFQNGANFQMGKLLVD